MAKNTEETVTITRSELADTIAKAIAKATAPINEKLALAEETNRELARESVGNKLASGVILETGQRKDSLTGEVIMLQDGYGKNVLDTDGNPIPRIFSNFHMSVLADDLFTGDRYEQAKAFASAHGYPYVQINASLSESTFMKHDKRDPRGCDRALAFRCNTDSIFSVEFLHETIERDASIAFDMQAPREREDNTAKVRKAG